MRLLCGWANAVPFADQILATLQQNQKGNAVHALASTEVNTPYVVAWRLVVLWYPWMCDRAANVPAHSEAERTARVLGLRLNNIMVRAWRA